MFDDDEPPVRLIDPHKEVLTGTGCELDAIGDLPDVDLPRAKVETDASYRERLAVKLTSWFDTLTPAIATGEYLDHWHRGATSGETNAPPDDTKPRENHVRDAVRANS